jgi:hypothetical protein
MRQYSPAPSLGAMSFLILSSRPAGGRRGLHCRSISRQDTDTISCSYLYLSASICGKKGFSFSLLNYSTYSTTQLFAVLPFPSPIAYTVCFSLQLRAYSYDLFFPFQHTAYSYELFFLVFIVPNARD